MADWWSLTDLACRAPDPSRRIAWCDDRWVSHAQWLILVGRWQQTFAASSALHWVIYLNDPVSFAAALLAAWHEGKVAVLP
ncbi:MAG: AMP-binding protein, partial [Pseudomonadota bacterium]